MEMLKRATFVLILLLVIVVAWIGSSVYFQSTNVSINPNAKSYTTQLRESFDIELLDAVTERTEKSFPVSPEEFLSLIGKD